MTSAAAPNTSQVRHSPARDTQELGPRPERLTGPAQPCAGTRGLGPRPERLTGPDQPCAGTGGLAPPA